MVNHLIVNPDLYALTFSTSDNIKFKMIKDNIKSVPKSKVNFTFFNNQQTLIVDKNFYECAIDEGIKFLRNNNLEDDVYWINKQGIQIPCGFYQVAVATPIIKKVKNIPNNIQKYFQKISSNLETEIYYLYDYITNKYVICLKDDNYVKLVLKFNRFILENGIAPFERIEFTSRYGKLEQKDYPMLNKKK